MSEQELVAVDQKLVDEMEQMVTKTAYLICDEQPDVPQPESLTDMDSFSLVQVLLELENTTDMKLLERLEDFQGESFRDLAEFIVRLAQADSEETRDEAGAATPQGETATA